MVAVEEVVKERDDYVKWRRLRKPNDIKPHYERFLMHKLTEDDAVTTLKLRLQVFIMEKSLLIRIFNPVLFFKHDF